MFVIWIALILFTLFGGNPIKVFNLRDKRSFLKSEETYQKLNSLMVDGDIYVSSGGIGDRIYISVAYKTGRNEESKMTFNSDSLEETINTAYDWAVERNLIKK